MYYIIHLYTNKVHIGVCFASSSPNLKLILSFARTIASYKYTEVEPLPSTNRRTQTGGLIAPVTFLVVPNPYALNNGRNLSVTPCLL